MVAAARSDVISELVNVYERSKHVQNLDPRLCSRYLSLGNDVGLRADSGPSRKRA